LWRDSLAPPVESRRLFFTFTRTQQKKRTPHDANCVVRILLLCIIAQTAEAVQEKNPETGNFKLNFKSSDALAYRLCHVDAVAAFFHGWPACESVTFPTRRPRCPPGRRRWPPGGQTRVCLAGFTRASNVTCSFPISSSCTTPVTIPLHFPPPALLISLSALLRLPHKLADVWRGGRGEVREPPLLDGDEALHHSPRQVDNNDIMVTICGDRLTIHNMS